MICTCTIHTPLGPMTAAAANGALTGLWFVGQKHYPAAAAAWQPAPDLPIFAALRAHLDRYFAGDDPGADIPLAPHGSPFQREVWQILQRIPRGRVVTYGDIAREIARSRGLERMSARAVGSAVGHNPISILISCHRVVGSDGSLTGYAGGTERKEALLRLEGVLLGQSRRS